MIVKCDACQTRFRIPDEKVTDKGVKVRCTKCQNTFRVTRTSQAGGEAGMPLPPPVPDLAPGPAPAFDPFAAFGPSEGTNFDEATRPFTLSAAALAQLGLSPVAPPPSQPPAPAPVSNPFGDDALSEDATSKLAHPPALPSPANLHDPFALLDASPQGQAASSPFERTQPEYPAPAEDPFADARAAFERTQPDVDAPDRSDFEMPSAFSQSTQPGMDDLSDALDPSASTGTYPGPADRGMFDMPAAPVSTSGLLDDVPSIGFGSAGGPQDEVTATGILSGRRTPPPLPIEPTRVAPAPAPASQVEPAPAAPSESAFRSVGGAIANIAAALLLLSGVAAVAGVYLNGGRVDLASLSPDHLQHLWTRTGDVVPRDVSNGLYDTQGGRAVLYVRGFVENRTGRPGKVKVTAEIYDGDQLLRPGSVYAGQSPTPEDLAAIAGPQDVEALVARLNAGAQVVPPGKRVPFLVPFYEYPTDLTGLRMKVTASAPESAARKR